MKEYYKYEYTAKCKVCGFTDTKKGNGDIDYCTECYSVEQGFYYIGEDNIDEDGNQWDDDLDEIVVKKDNTEGEK